MPELKMDAEGYLVDGEGNRVTLGDESDPVKVTNAQTQDQVEKVIKERLARQNDKIKTLESQVTKTPELEKMLKELREEKQSLESQLSEAKKNAEAEVANQMTKLQREREELQSKLESESKGRVQDQVTNLVLSKAGDRFINPAEDIVPRLLQVHKREPVKDEQGNVVKHADLFKISFKNEQDKEIEDWLPADKALEVIASKPEYSHYVKSSGQSGSGGGSYVNTANLQRSKMSVEDKTAFIGKHGAEAFQNLPE